MTLVGALQILVMSAFVVICIRLETGSGATRKFARFWLDATRRGTLRNCLLAYFAVFGIDALETTNDARITAALGLDFTPLIQSIEGGFVAAMQRLLGVPLLSPVFAFAYVVGFIGLLMGLALAYDRANDPRRLVLVTWAYAANFLAVLPFYVFFPVSEPWSFEGSGVLPLTDRHLGPWVMELIRPMSGINNCFPSYHVSLTVSLMLIALDGRRTALTWFAQACGWIVIVSTMVLGFHWLLDVIVGGAFGVGVFALGRSLFERRFPRLSAATPIDSGATIPSKP